MRIAIIDNYDSFTFNLVHYLQECTDNLKVIRYDQLRLDEIESYNAILISPGPGHPHEYKLLYELLRLYYKTKPILGICLGHQIIGSYFGASLSNMDNVVHGQELETQLVKLTSPIFNEIPDVFFTGRYHSWIINNLPEELEITAIDHTTGNIMAISHKKFNIHGIQFHPESIMTRYGKKIIQNWINNIS